jgi:uncharacterized protein (TIGR02569 family)
VLEAYGLVGEPTRLEGGQGRSYVVGATVLRPVDDPEADEWIASAVDELVEDGFRVPRPVRPTATPGWTAAGWSAWTLVVGEHRTWGADWPRALETAVRFHAAIGHWDRPGFLERRADPFARADRIAWGEAAPPAGGPLSEVLARLSTHRRPVERTAQVVHGDLAGNLLWSDGLAPAVIDLSPYWRPAGLGAAQLVVDAVLWYGADLSLADQLLDHEPADGRQLVLRALIFRLAVDALLSCSASGVRWSPSQVEWDLVHAAPLEGWVTGARPPG